MRQAHIYNCNCELIWRWCDRAIARFSGAKVVRNHKCPEPKGHPKQLRGFDFPIRKYTRTCFTNNSQWTSKTIYNHFRVFPMTHKHHLGSPESILVTPVFLLFHHIFYFNVNYNLFSCQQIVTPLCIRQDVINSWMHVEGRDDLTATWKIKCYQMVGPTHTQLPFKVEPNHTFTNIFQ